MNDSTIESILSASTIEAIRVSESGTCEVLDPDTYGSLTHGRQMTSSQCELLKCLLLDSRSWFFAKKRCLPKGTVLFRLDGGAGKTSVAVGFSCLDWIVNSAAERRGAFFDPVQDQVRNLVKSLFPELASSSPRSMWKTGIIAKLRDAGSKATSGG